MNLYTVGLSICRKVLRIMFWEVPPAEWRMDPCRNDSAQNSSIFNFQDEEYENPASVKSNHGEQEMQEGETIEEFEDRVLNKRAAHLNTILKYDL